MQTAQRAVIFCIMRHAWTDWMNKENQEMHTKTTAPPPTAPNHHQQQQPNKKIRHKKKCLNSWFPFCSDFDGKAKTSFILSVFLSFFRFKTSIVVVIAITLYFILFAPFLIRLKLNWTEQKRHSYPKNQFAFRLNPKHKICVHFDISALCMNRNLFISQKRDQCFSECCVQRCICVCCSANASGPFLWAWILLNFSHFYNFANIFY